VVEVDEVAELVDVLELLVELLLVTLLALDMDDDEVEALPLDMELEEVTLDAELVPPLAAVSFSMAIFPVVQALSANNKIKTVQHF